MATPQESSEDEEETQIFIDINNDFSESTNNHKLLPDIRIHRCFIISTLPLHVYHTKWFVKLTRI
jgi:hypothetical protein